jgi:hypothetical protein
MLVVAAPPRPGLEYRAGADEAGLQISTEHEGGPSLCDEKHRHGDATRPNSISTQ